MVNQRLAVMARRDPVMNGWLGFFRDVLKGCRMKRSSLLAFAVAAAFGTLTLADAFEDQQPGSNFSDANGGKYELRSSTDNGRDSDLQPGERFMGAPAGINIVNSGKTETYADNPPGTDFALPPIPSITVLPDVSKEQASRDVEEDRGMAEDDMTLEPRAIPAGAVLEPATQPTTMPSMP